MPETPTSSDKPLLSLVVLSWNNLELTRECVESLRRHTDVPSELIVVDNGSTDGSAEYAESAADIAVRNDSNLGFAPGMNAGLAEARGVYVAFINNDTVFPSAWASRLIETLESASHPGIVIPAVTAAGNPVTVRDSPGTEQVVLAPFGEFPSGVVYLMETEMTRALGGWNEDYQTASAEDLDLSFTVWAHGLDIIVDERVLVEHESQASVRNLVDRKTLYRDNLEQFLRRWESKPLNDPLLSTTDPALFQIRQEQAQTAVIWIRRMLAARDEANSLRGELKSVLKRSRERGSWFRSRS